MGVSRARHDGIEESSLPHECDVADRHYAHGGAAELNRRNVTVAFVYPSSVTHRCRMSNYHLLWLAAWLSGQDVGLWLADFS